MYRNISYSIREDYTGEIRLDTWDVDGNPVTEHHTHESWLYYESPNGNFNSMFGTKISKKEFINTIERSKWLKQNRDTKKIFENLNPIREFLIDYYEGQQEEPEFVKHELRKHFLDIEVATDGKGFPVPDKAAAPINVISIYDSIDKEFNVWVLPDKRHDSNRTAKFKNAKRMIGVDFKADKATKKVTPNDEVEIDVKYHVFDRETEMLTHFCKWFNNNSPDVLSGWNVDGFDVPYIVNRITKVCPAFTVDLLSPIGNVKQVTKIDKLTKKSTTSFEIEGVAVLDYQFLYRDKFNIIDKKPNYKLDTISGIELGVGKLTYDCSITEFWQTDFERFVEYNIIDTARVFQLDDKLKYIDLTRMICNFGLCEYQAIYKSAPYIFGALTLQCRNLNKLIISSTPGENIAQGFEGAHVWPTIAGMYRRGIASFDLASLYPNIICTVNISPETKIGKIVDDSDPNLLVMKMANGRIKYLTPEEMTNLTKKATRASNGVYYINPDLKEGVMPSFISRLYSKRVEFKGKMKSAVQEGREAEASHFDRVQHATKIFLNSIYGQLGSRYFPMYDLDNAEAVTLTGQKIIVNTGKFVNSYLQKVYNSKIDNHIVAGDTDSVYCRVDPIVNHVIGEDGDMEEHLHEVCTEIDKLEGQINKFASSFVKNKLFSPRDRIVFERETFCTQGAFLAKKRYILRVRNSDGERLKDGTYKMGEYFKYTGVEVKKSETPDAIKDAMKYIIENALRKPWTNKEYHLEIDKIWTKFKGLDPDDIAFWKGYNTTKDSPGFLQAEKGANAHAKATIYHNQFLDKLNLAGKYEAIQQGDRIRFAYINKNNPYGIQYIAWLESMYPEFRELFEVDRVTMFSKVFLKPLKRFEDVNGWRAADPTRQVLCELDDL